jgi:hypothetical protein
MKKQMTNKVFNAYMMPNSGVNISQISAKRDWMDNVSNAHAYHCFPLSISNTLGWGISFDEDISFIWDGIDTDKEDGHITILSGNKYVNENRRSATLSFDTFTKFITDENTTLLTMPVPNLFIDGIHLYTTLISTSFFRYPLPLAAKVTKPNVVITIPAKTPIAAIVPISLQDINQYELDINDYVFSKEDEIKNKKYGEVSQLKNRVGEWTHFYRNATDESDIPVGKHELKTIRLKTNDKRKNNGR